MSHWFNELSQVVNAKVYTHKHEGKDVKIYSNTLTQGLTYWSTHTGTLQTIQ